MTPTTSGRKTRQRASPRGFPSHAKTEMVSRSSRCLFRALSTVTSAINERTRLSSSFESLTLKHAVKPKLCNSSILHLA